MIKASHKMKELLFDDLGRKFLFAVFFSLLGFILVLFKYLSANDWCTFILWMSGIFAGTNITEKIFKK